MPAKKTTTIAIRVPLGVRKELEDLRDEIKQDLDPMIDHPTLSSVSRHLLGLGLEIHQEKNAKKNLEGEQR